MSERACKEARENQLEAISQLINREVQAQIRGLRREQYDARIKFLEQRVENLEARGEPSPGLYFGIPFPREVSRVARQEVQREPGAGFDVAAPSPSISTKTYAPLEITDSIRGNEDCKSDMQESALPRSLYNYCIQRLSVSEKPFQDAAFFFMMLLMIVQFITMTCFVVYNDLHNNSIGVTPLKNRETDGYVYKCMFGATKIYGTPLLQYCMGYISCILVASIIRFDDARTLAAAFPKHDEHPGINRFLAFAWFWQAVYLPGCFSLEAATMFADSPDALDIVMNTLAVTFILEIDTMLYHNVLSEEHKQAYQQLAGRYLRDTPESETCSWAMFTWSIVCMTIYFTVLVVLLEDDNLYGDSYLQSFRQFATPLYFCSYAGRWLLQSLFRTPNDAQGQFSTSRCFLRCLFNCVSTLGAGVGGVFVYCVSNWLCDYEFKGLIAHDFSACVPGVDD